MINTPFGIGQAGHEIADQRAQRELVEALASLK